MRFTKFFSSLTWAFCFLLTAFVSSRLCICFLQIKTQLAAEGKSSGSNTMISSHNTLDTKSVVPMQQEETRSAPADAETSQSRAAGCSDTQVATVRALLG